MLRKILYIVCVVAVLFALLSTPASAAGSAKALRCNRTVCSGYNYRGVLVSVAVYNEAMHMPTYRTVYLRSRGMWVWQSHGLIGKLYWPYYQWAYR